MSLGNDAGADTTSMDKGPAATDGVPTSDITQSVESAVDDAKLAEGGAVANTRMGIQEGEELDASQLAGEGEVGTGTTSTAGVKGTPPGSEADVETTIKTRSQRIYGVPKLIEDLISIGVKPETAEDFANRVSGKNPPDGTTAEFPLQDKDGNVIGGVSLKAASKTGFSMFTRRVRLNSQPGTEFISTHEFAEDTGPITDESDSFFGRLGRFGNNISEYAGEVVNGFLKHIGHSKDDVVVVKATIVENQFVGATRFLNGKPTTIIDESAGVDVSTAVDKIKESFKETPGKSREVTVEDEAEQKQEQEQQQDEDEGTDENNNTKSKKKSKNKSTSKKKVTWTKRMIQALYALGLLAGGIVALIELNRLLNGMTGCWEYRNGVKFQKITDFNFSGNNQEYCACSSTSVDTTPPLSQWCENPAPSKGTPYYVTCAPYQYPKCTGAGTSGGLYYHYFVPNLINTVLTAADEIGEMAKSAAKTAAKGVEGIIPWIVMGACCFVAIYLAVKGIIDEDYIYILFSVIFIGAGITGFILIKKYMIS